MISEAVERCRSEVERLAAAALAPPRRAPDLARLLAEAAATVEGALAAARPWGTPPPACGPGCAGCCVVNVGTLAVEGAVAAAWLRGRLAPPAASTLAARLLAFHDRVRWLEDRERVAARLACPLLDGEGRCGIHPVRPLACRSVTSLDAADCAAALAGSLDEDAPVVRMDLAQQALYREALAAVAGALEAAGLDGRCRDVSGMIGAFLADPAALLAFLRGERLPLE